LGSAGCRSTADESGKSENTNSAENSNVSANSNNNAVPEAVKSSNNVDRYRITASGSHFTAKVPVGGLLSSLGHDHTIAIRDFTGEAHVTPDTIQPASLQLTIKAGSLAETEKEINESDRQKIERSIQEEALETAKYPQIIFKSTSVSARKTGEGNYQVQINGSLTLHGVTRPIAIPAQVTLTGNKLTARGQFTVRHSDYQIKRLSAGAGTVKAKEEITLSFNLVGSKV
jgi:polyisoprenoid-binding protein YceI